MKFPKLTREQKQALNSQKSFAQALTLNNIERALVASQVWRTSMFASITPSIAASVYVTGIPGTLEYKPLSSYNGSDISVDSNEFKEWLLSHNPQSVEIIFRVSAYIGIVKVIDGGKEFGMTISTYDFKSVDALKEIKRLLDNSVNVITSNDYTDLVRSVLVSGAIELVKIIACVDVDRFLHAVKTIGVSEFDKDVAEFISVLEESPEKVNEICNEPITEDGTERLNEYCPVCGAILNKNGICVNTLCNYVAEMEG